MASRRAQNGASRAWARYIEAKHKDDRAWSQERLSKPDACIVEWRKLASKHNRGLQPVV